MAFDRFFIGPLQTGLQQNLRPFLIADDAFDLLQNAYVFRGRVRKRFGSRLMGSGFSSPVTEPLFSRLRVQVGTIGAPTAVPGTIFKLGQMFSAGDQIFTVSVLGTPGMMLSTGPGTGTFNTTTGAFVLSGTGLAGGTPIWFYPAEPVMGLCNYQNGPINNQPSYGFDTQFAYLFSGGFWQRSGTVLLTGTNLNFVETCNYRGTIPGGPPSLFISNFKDPIWYTQDGSTWVETTGANAFYFLPNNGAIHTGAFVNTARLIVSFKNRLLLLNTVEDNGSGTLTSYTNRVRYSYNGSPFARNAWYEPNQQDSSGGVVNKNNIAAGAGFIDATTEEQIISAEFIKDRLIVYFERSTWELAYTGNYVIPFVWQKINTELGAESTFSVILTMGTTGVHACSGSNVERIDTKIPDKVFEIQNRNLGVQRVYGIRDYFTELVYWSFPATQDNANTGDSPYPTQILIYNYRNSSWAIFTDCITAFGYFEQQNMNSSITWASLGSLTWEEASMTWGSGVLDANFRQVIAGNQQGYTFICDPEENRNARAMQITNMVQSGTTVVVTCVDHTLTAVNTEDPTIGDYVILENFQGCTLTSTPSTLYPDNIFPVYDVLSNTQFVIPSVILTGTYTGGGTVSRVSNINIESKQWNPYLADANNVYLARIDFGVMKTAFGEITVDYYPSASDVSMLEAGTGTGTIMGNGVLETRAYDPAFYPLEKDQQRLWHPVYFQSTGECIQILMYFSPAQIVVADIAFSEFELDGLVLMTKRDSDRLQ